MQDCFFIFSSSQSVLRNFHVQFGVFVSNDFFLSTDRIFPTRSSSSPNSLNSCDERVQRSVYSLNCAYFSYIVDVWTRSSYGLNLEKRKAYRDIGEKAQVTLVASLKLASWRIASYRETRDNDVSQELSERRSGIWVQDPIRQWAIRYVSTVRAV